MKVLFIPCGIGLGHATRTNAIINKIRKKSDIVVSTYGEAYKFFKRQGIKTYKIKGIEYPRGEPKFTLSGFLLKNLDLPIVLARNYFVLSDIINKEKPDIVFIDSDPSSFIVANYLRQKDIFLSNFPALFFERKSMPEWILNKLYYQIGVLETTIDYMLKYAESLVFPSFIKYKNKPPKMEIVDLIVRKKPNQISPEKEIRNSLKIKEKFYLVSLSNYLEEDVTLSILKTLKLFKEKKFIVTSTSIKKYRKIGNLTLNPFLKKYFEYLKISEGIICSSGHSTMSEAIVYKKPIFSIPIKEHVEQITNAIMVEKYDLGSNYIIKENFKEDVFKRKLSYYFKNQEIYESSLKKRNVKGDGAKETADVISKLTK